MESPPPPETADVVLAGVGVTTSVGAVAATDLVTEDEEDDVVEVDVAVTPSVDRTTELLTTFTNTPFP